MDERCGVRTCATDLRAHAAFVVRADGANEWGTSLCVLPGVLGGDAFRAAAMSAPRPETLRVLPGEPYVAVPVSEDMERAGYAMCYVCMHPPAAARPNAVAGALTDGYPVRGDAVFARAM